jgi:hypothetical protein
VCMLFDQIPWEGTCCRKKSTGDKGGGGHPVECASNARLLKLYSKIVLEQASGDLVGVLHNTKTKQGEKSGDTVP